MSLNRAAAAILAAAAAAGCSTHASRPAAPVGLALVDGGKRMVAADSDRFGVRGAVSSLAVVSIPAALAGGSALLGYLRAAGFPREMTLEPGGRTLLVTNSASGQLETVSIGSLP
jgi:hypothetical protein